MGEQVEMEMTLEVNPNAGRKPRDAWEALILRYAGSKAVCNCGQAYYTNCGQSSRLVEGKWITAYDNPCCQYGCSSNQLQAKNYVAEMVMKEFKIPINT